MIRVYKWTTIISGLFILTSAFVSFAVKNSDFSYKELVNNIVTGVFSSACLLTASTLISYIREEKRLVYEYGWSLSELKCCALELQTIPKDLEINTSKGELYYSKYRQLNKCLKEKFALVDVGVFFKNRKLFRLIIDIQNKIYPLVDLTNTAIECYRAYLNGTVNEQGERNYTKEKFKKDMQEVVTAIDDFDGTGKSLTMWVRTMELKYAQTAWGTKQSISTGQDANQTKEI